MKDTNPLTAVIIEDEINGLQALINLITSFTDIKIIGQASDVDSGVSVIMETKPQIIFLDIRLGNRSGFDIIKQLPDKNFSLVITSAYQEHALEAIKEEAVDYLLKPVMKDDLLKALQRIRERISKNNHQLESNWPSVQKSIDKISWDKIAIPSASGLSFISLMQILRCEADGPYTKLILKAAMPLLTSRNLGEYEKMLTPAMGYLRVHHNVIINMHEVVRYIRGEGGQIIMSDGEKVEISRRKKTEIMEWIDKNG